MLLVQKEMTVSSNGKKLEIKPTVKTVKTEKRIFGVDYKVEKTVYSMNRDDLVDYANYLDFAKFQADRFKQHQARINSSDYRAFGSMTKKTGEIEVYNINGNENFSALKRVLTTIPALNVDGSDSITVVEYNFLKLSELEVRQLKSRFNLVEKENKLLNGLQILEVYHTENEVDGLLSKKLCSQILGYESQYCRIALLLKQEFNELLRYDAEGKLIIPSTRTLNECYKKYNDDNVFDKSEAIKEVLEESDYYLSNVEANTKREKEKIKKDKEKKDINRKLKLLDIIFNSLNADGKEMFNKGKFKDMFKPELVQGYTAE